jgi:uncharacterized membrane protein
VAKDISDAVGTALGRIARDGAKTVSANVRKASSNDHRPSGKGLAAGAAGLGLVALAPLAGKRVSKLAKGATDKVGGNVKNAISHNVKDAVPGGKLAGALTDKLGGGDDGGGGDKEHGRGVGKGRRMPVQQDIDIGAPLDSVYERWIDYEEWPNFMHRVDQVTQDDKKHLTFKAKIWGISREFKAEITDQVPKRRIKWRVVEGMTHNGVVTFHELTPTLTRVEVSLDVEPGSLIEKAARGMRHVKRAVRADLARFKAYVLMEEEDTGSGRKSSSAGRKRSSASKRSRSASASGRASSNGRKSSSSHRSSSNGRSRSRTSSRKRSGSRS